MKSFIDSPEATARLLAAAESWIGTHYVPDGAVKGTGCSCSMLPWVILKECGFGVKQPPVRGDMLKTEILPLMLSWLTEAEGTYFVRVQDMNDLQRGDVLLFDAGIGHLAVSMGGKTIIHSWQRDGVHYTHVGDSYEKRLVGVWRPIVKEPEIYHG